MRRLIEARLAEARNGVADPAAGLLRNVIGPVSDELRAVIAAPGHAAAVLLGLVERSDGLTIILTERSRHLNHHAGQVSLPGGRIDVDRETAEQAALREAWEEIGLAPDAVDVAGSLDTLVTGTGFVVTPIVGFVRGNFSPVPNPDEVSCVFEVPLADVLRPDAFRPKLRDRYGSTFRMYEFQFGPHLIWGATAAMLLSFSDLINSD